MILEVQNGCFGYPKPRIDSQQKPRRPPSATRSSL